MKITVVGRQMSVYDEMKDLIEKKLAKFDKFFSEGADATVTLSCRHNEKRLEITICAAGTMFRSEVGAESFREALDDGIYAIERQIRKNKTRLEKRFRSQGISFFEDSAEAYEEEPEEILRVKTYSTKPMSADEAILQMNLLGHKFFVFTDDQTNRTCVVYSRNDGGYGMIVPE